MITKQQYAGVMRWAAVSLGSQTLTAAAIGALPWLAPFKKVVQYVFAQLLKVLAEDAEFGLFFLYTDFRVTPQGKALFDAALKNYQVRDAGTEEEKALAKEDLRNKFRTFARLTA